MLLRAAEDGEPGEGAVEYDRWLRRRSRILDQGSAPSHRVATVTRLVEAEKPAIAGAAEVRITEIAGRDLLRPGGKRFGALVHEVLSRAALDAEPGFTLPTAVPRSSRARPTAA